MNAEPRVTLHDILLWAICGFVWWSWAHFLAIFIPGNTLFPGLPAIIAGSIMGVVAYFRFIIDLRNLLPLKIAYIRVNMLMFILGFIVGAIIGWRYTLGILLGDFGWMAPPTTGSRLYHGLIVGTIGLLANSGMMFSLGKLGNRPWVLFLSLTAAAILLYVVVPVIMILVLGNEI
jgi:hypothetical protein